MLLHLRRYRVSALNDSGTFVWQLVNGHRSVKTIAARVAEHYGIDVAQAERDVVQFFEKLAERDLVEFVRQPEAKPEPQRRP